MKKMNLLKTIKYFALMSFITFPLCANAKDGSNDATGNVVIDGNVDDWGGVNGVGVDSFEKYDSAGVKDFKICYSPDGSKVYLCYTGTTPGCYYSDFLNYNITITDKNGNGRTYNIGNFKYNGGKVEYVNNASDYNTPGDFICEVELPKNVIPNGEYSVSFQGKNSSVTVKSADIVKIDGVDYVPEDKGPSIYEGIKIDGKFSDWNSINKYDANDPSNCLDSAAAVYDGDYLYLYINEATKKRASEAGTHGNGMYSVVTDLGRNLVIKINNDGTVSGPEGVISCHYGDQWEIAIPASSLPQYDKSLSFGLYQSVTFVDNIVNLQPDNGNTEKFSSITYDGHYSDWDGYPHKLIQYATAGTNELLSDGESAIYADGSTLYGHVVSPMLRHTSKNGSDFTSGITFRFNEDNSQEFSPRLVYVDSEGNINWNPNFNSMEPGKTYEFYIASLSAWGQSKNINDLDEKHDTLFGKMMITVGGYGKVDQCEYYLDLEKVAEYLNVDANELKMIEAQFKRIGHEWVATAGASSGAIFIAIVGFIIAFVSFRKNEKKKESIGATK